MVVVVVSVGGILYRTTESSSIRTIYYRYDKTEKSAYTIVDIIYIRIYDFDIL